MSLELTKELANIATTLNREEALVRLSEIRSGESKAQLATAAKKLDKRHYQAIRDMVNTLSRRSKKPKYEGFKLGDRVEYVGGGYKGLKGVELTIVEFDPPWVICARNNGYYAHGTIASDLRLLDRS